MDTALYLVSDMFNTTCAQLNLDNRDILLCGHLNGNYSSLTATMTMTNSLVFGPRYGLTICHPSSSSLFTHLGSDCNQAICAVPTSCRYLGKKAISTDSTLWQYIFSCICGQPMCTELLLWLRPDSFNDQFNRISLCEILVVWLCYQYGILPTVIVSWMIVCHVAMATTHRHDKPWTLTWWNNHHVVFCALCKNIVQWPFKKTNLSYVYRYDFQWFNILNSVKLEMWIKTTLHFMKMKTPCLYIPHQLPLLSTLTIVIIFFRRRVSEMFVTSYSVTYCINIPGNLRFCSHHYCAFYDECK